jgi:hypothetical protein
LRNFVIILVISDEGGGRNRCFGLSAGSLHITSSIMKSVSTSSITIATAWYWDLSHKHDIAALAWLGLVVSPLLFLMKVHWERLYLELAQDRRAWIEISDRIFVGFLIHCRKMNVKTREIQTYMLLMAIFLQGSSV